MTDQEKTKKPMNAREHLRQQSLKNNTGDKAELLDPIADKFTNNTDNDELVKIKKQLEDTKKELVKQKKLTTNNISTFSIISPGRLRDGNRAADYKLKVFPDVMDYMETNCRGSKNIAFNYIFREGMKVINEKLKNNNIVLDTEGEEKDN